MMKKKILSLVLALTLCLGVAVPTFAAGTETYTVDGITITIDSSGTISYTGSGTLTGYTAEGGIMLLHEATNGYDGIDTVTISIGSGITIDDDIIDGMDLLKYMEKFLMKNYSVKSVNIYSSTMNVQTFGGFTDVKENDYFADPVLWAVDKKITAGTSETTFSPNENCTVAQILTFLYRAYGSPSYLSPFTNAKNPFSDVKRSDYYYDAAQWAYKKGIATGSTFDGDKPCTRAMAVTYMWKAAGSPSAEAASFTDVSADADYAQAVAWAVEKGVTAGTSDTTFSPDSVCTRGQIVTFLRLARGQ